jgi:8-oxo-dGTP diphosphatase
MDGAIGITFNKKGQLLLVKRRDIPIWVMPGGRIEPSETPQKAAVRESFEESGYKVKIIRKIAEYRDPKHTRVNHIFECKITGGLPTIGPESKEVVCFDLDKLPEPRSPAIDLWLSDLNLRKSAIIKKDLEATSVKDIVKTYYQYPVVVFRYLLVKIGIRINT